MDRPNPTNEAKTVSLEIEGTVFKCCKRSLMSASDYFKSMFSSNFIEKDKDIIKLEEVQSGAMVHILDFIEDGKLNFLKNVEECLSVLKYASMLQFCEIQKLCEKFLIENLRPNNCLKIYQDTHKYGFYHVAAAASTFRCWFFEDLSDSEYFLSQSLEDVQDLLGQSSLNLNTNGEWLVWEAIVKWIEHEEERKYHIMELLHCLDFASLTNDDLSTMMFYQEIIDNSLATMFLKEVKELRESNIEVTKEEPNDYADEKEMMKKEARDMAIRVLNNCHGRKPSELPCVTCYKKRIEDRDIEVFPVVLFYSIDLKKVVNIVHLSKIDQSSGKCVGFRVCAIGPSIYISGGQYIIGGKDWNTDFWSYNSITENWVVHAQLPQKRRNHMTCVFNSFIYLIGGYGKHRISLSSMDAYDTKAEKWISCPNIPFHSMGAHCTYKNRILVFTDGRLYSYYPERKVWISSEIKCGEQKCFSTAMVHGEFIYLLGSYSKDIYRIKPDHSNVVNYFASFKHMTENVCLNSSRLISFAEEEDTRKVSEIINIIEVIKIPKEKEEDEINGGGKDCAVNTNSSESNISEVVWRRRVDDAHSSRIVSNFYGCFNLFKVCE